MRRNVNSQRDYEGIKEDDNIKEREFFEIGGRNEVGDKVGEEIKDNEQYGKELWKGKPLSE